MEDDHSIMLSLRIMFIDKSDYGVYSCEASNKLGKDSDKMALFGKISWSYCTACVKLVVDPGIFRAGSFHLLNSRPARRKRIRCVAGP